MLSVTSEYALRAALVLAREYGIRHMRADEVADAIGAPRNYLGKTLNALVRAGIATSARGPTGGFQLARSPNEITVSEVIDCFDEPRHNPYCLLGSTPCDSRNPCVAHQKWTAIQMARREPLAMTSLAHLLADAPAHVRKINSEEYDHAVA